MLRKWELLDRDDKAKWVPQGHRTVLANDETWAPLLSDGPPLCGKAPKKEEPGEAKEETSAAPEKEEPGEAKAEHEEVVQDEERKGGEKKEKKKEPTRDKKRKSEQNLDIPKRLKF